MTNTVQNCLQIVIAFLLCAGTGLRAASSPEMGAYYELRLYTVTSNKMEGVLERFRETVEPVRQKHGIKTVGYWSAPGTTNGGTFAYLLSAASREDLQKREKAFGSDLQFKEGYAASNKKHGKTVDKIVSLPLTEDSTAKFDFTVAISRACLIFVFIPFCLASWMPFATVGATTPCRFTNGTDCTASAGGSRERRMATGTINSSAFSRARVPMAFRNRSVHFTKTRIGSAWKWKLSAMESCARL